MTGRRESSKLGLSADMMEVMTFSVDTAVVYTISGGCCERGRTKGGETHDKLQHPCVWENTTKSPAPSYSPHTATSLDGLVVGGKRTQDLTSGSWTMQLVCKLTANTVRV